ncbi:MAG: hypothetical protein ACTSRZ_18985 [Promethearchaeota archaeon]
MVSITTIVTGISALIILATGYLTGISCFFMSKKRNAPILILVAFFLLCMGSFYLGTVVSFFSLLITGSNINGYLAGQLCYTWSPIAISLSLYIGFKVIKPKLSKPFAIAYLLTGIPFWYGLLLLPNITIGFEIPESGLGLIDIQLQSFVQILVALYLFTFALVQIPCFIWLSRNVMDKAKKKALMNALGYTLFVICGILDSMVEFPNPILLLIVRIFMAIGYILLYLGYIG